MGVGFGYGADCSFWHSPYRRALGIFPYKSFSPQIHSNHDDSPPPHWGWALVVPVACAFWHILCRRAPGTKKVRIRLLSPLHYHCERLTLFAPIHRFSTSCLSSLRPAPSPRKIRPMANFWSWALVSAALGPSLFWRRFYIAAYSVCRRGIYQASYSAILSL